MPHIHPAHHVSRHLPKNEQPKFFELRNGSNALQSAMFPEGKLSVAAHGALRVSANGLTSAQEKILHHIAHVSCTLKLGVGQHLLTLINEQGSLIDPPIDWERLDAEELARTEATLFKGADVDPNPQGGNVIEPVEVAVTGNPLPGSLAAAISEMAKPTVEGIHGADGNQGDVGVAVLADEVKPAVEAIEPPPAGDLPPAEGVDGGVTTEAEQDAEKDPAADDAAKDPAAKEGTDAPAADDKAAETAGKSTGKNRK